MSTRGYFTRDILLEMFTTKTIVFTTKTNVFTERLCCFSAMGHSWEVLPWFYDSSEQYNSQKIHEEYNFIFAAYFMSLTEVMNL